MSNISNESIWGKLSEMDKKMDKILKDKESLNENKQEIETNQVQSILNEEQIDKIVHKYANALNKVMINMFNYQWKKLNIISGKLNKIRKRPQITIKGCRFYLTSVAIFVLSAIGLISIYINFRQCSSYGELSNKYNNQLTTNSNLKIENDSLKVKRLMSEKKKK